MGITINRRLMVAQTDEEFWAGKPCGSGRTNPRLFKFIVMLSSPGTGRVEARTLPAAFGPGGALITPHRSGQSAPETGAPR